MTEATEVTERKDPLVGSRICLYFSQDMAKTKPSFVALINGAEIQYNGIYNRLTPDDVSPIDREPVWEGPHTSFNYVRTLEPGRFLVQPEPEPAKPPEPAALAL